MYQCIIVVGLVWTQPCANLSDIHDNKNSYVKVTMVRLAVKATLISLRLPPFPFSVDLLTTFLRVLLDTWSINSKLPFPKSCLS